MSTQITAHPEAATASAQLQDYRTALAVSRYIVEVTPVSPAQITVDCASFRPGEPRLNLHFYHSVEDVDAFGRFFGLPVQEKPHPGGQYVVASGEVDGVPVLAWTLLAADAAEAVSS